MRYLGLYVGMMLMALLAASPASAVYPPMAVAVSEIVDLTETGTGDGYIGSAYFQWLDQAPTGTGYIDPFLRIQATRVESGVNSDGTRFGGDPYAYNEKTGIWTHSILVSNFGQVENPDNGALSIRFLLDVNESTGGNAEYIGLDRLRVYVADTDAYRTLEDLDDHAALLYDMDASDAGNAVHLNYALNSGSGTGDMFAYLPVSLFAGHETDYLYLFSQFGGEGGQWVTNDGFEEWTNIDSTVPPPPVPEPATLLLLGGGLLGAGLLRRRRS